MNPSYCVDVCFVKLECLFYAQNKCTRYWPDAEDNKTYGQVHVVNLKETPNPHYILREFLVHHEDVSSKGRGRRVMVR